MNTEQKYDSLKKILGPLGRILIAYSGGVDSTFLLKAAVDCLGSENVLACIGISASLGQSQLRQALEFGRAIGASVRSIQLHELSDARYAANKADRCFHCKSHLYGILRDIAKEERIEHIICGSNFDDKDDFRPGSRAAKVFGVIAPLADAELTKDDIRNLSRKLDLAAADMPASPCLASRITYGLEVTEQRLNQIEQAEDFLRSLGFVEFRVRHHGDIARIEVLPGQIEKIACESVREKIVKKLKSLGFKFVSLDLQGFRSGALNETLTKQEKEGAE
jgi:uncharacterized protein